MSYEREFDLICLRHSLDTLERLRGGWRPSKRLLSRARNADRWKIDREQGAMGYQFVGNGDSDAISRASAICNPEAVGASAAWCRGVMPKATPDHAWRAA